MSPTPNREEKLAENKQKHTYPKIFFFFFLWNLRCLKCDHIHEFLDSDTCLLISRTQATLLVLVV